MGDFPPASGEGPIGDPHSVHTAEGSAQAALEDRGVRGAFLSYSSDGTTQQIELPLAFAQIECKGAAVTVTVHKDVHPDCQLGGTPIALTCPGSDGAAAAKAWEREMEQAIKSVNDKPWGVSKSFVREQWEWWTEEGRRCKGMTVYQYFENMGLGKVYDETWSWCKGVLEILEKEKKSIEIIREINYYRRKVDKTELYEDMELTDYMNVLKHRDLVPAKRKVSYANFIHADRDSSGRRKVGSATVFVSHVWKMTAAAFFEVCLAEMDDDDYAWIDLYLHNQYQGAVSTIGDENSEYWVKKFSDLIGNIGKVIAIVTDWESPVMLTRIWCLFELNAAIDMKAKLKFVATAVQRQDLWINLHAKFKSLEGIVNSIDVRKCDAKRPHEISDKQIFLNKLSGEEDTVNKKLQKEMQRWLCRAAERAVHRTSPYRKSLDQKQIKLEKDTVGKPRALLARGLETVPAIGQIARLFGTMVLVVCAVIFGNWLISDEAIASGSNSTVTSEPVPSWLEWLGDPQQTDACVSDWRDCKQSALTPLPSALVLVAGGYGLEVYQARRQLRRPPLFGEVMTRNRLGISLAIALAFSTLVPYFAWINGGWHPVISALGGIFATLCFYRVFHHDVQAAIRNAELCAAVTQLYLDLGDRESDPARKEEISKTALEISGEAAMRFRSTVGQYDLSDRAEDPNGTDANPSTKPYKEKLGCYGCAQKDQATSGVSAAEAFKLINVAYKKAKDVSNDVPFKVNEVPSCDVEICRVVGASCCKGFAEEPASSCYWLVKVGLMATVMCFSWMIVYAGINGLVEIGTASAADDFVVYSPGCNLTAPPQYLREETESEEGGVCGGEDEPPCQCWDYYRYHFAPIGQQVGLTFTEREDHRQRDPGDSCDDDKPVATPRFTLGSRIRCWAPADPDAFKSTDIDSDPGGRRFDFASVFGNNYYRCANQACWKLFDPHEELSETRSKHTVAVIIFLVCGLALTISFYSGYKYKFKKKLPAGCLSRTDDLVPHCCLLTISLPIIICGQVYASGMLLWKVCRESDMKKIKDCQRNREWGIDYSCKVARMFGECLYGLYSSFVKPSCLFIFMPFTIMCTWMHFKLRLNPRQSLAVLEVGSARFKPPLRGLCELTALGLLSSIAMVLSIAGWLFYWLFWVEQPKNSLGSAAAVVASMLLVGVCSSTVAPFASNRAERWAEKWQIELLSDSEEDPARPQGRPFWVVTGSSQCSGPPLCPRQKHAPTDYTPILTMQR